MILSWAESTVSASPWIRQHHGFYQINVLEQAWSRNAPGLRLARSRNFQGFIDQKADNII